MKFATPPGELLIRSGIFVEPIQQKSPSEPQGGGIVASNDYAAPTELGVVVWYDRLFFR